MSNLTPEPTRWSIKTPGNDTIYGTAFTSPAHLAKSFADRSGVSDGRPHNAEMLHGDLIPRLGRLSAESSWYGNARNFAELELLMTDGWTRGAERVQKAASEVRDGLGDLKPVAIKRTRVWADEGDEIDHDRLRSGDVESMWRGTRRKKRAKLAPAITVGVAWGGNANITSEGMFWTGAVAIAMADLLEDAGYRVSLVAADGGTGTDPLTHKSIRTLTVVCAKDFDEPLNPSAMAALMCHAGIYRSYGFYAILTMDVNVPHGFGSAAEFHKIAKSAEDLGPYAGTELVAVPYCRSHSQAITTLRELIAKVADVE